MAEIAGLFIIELDGLLVDREALGTQVRFNRGTERWRIDFPEDAASFRPQMWAGRPRDGDPRFYEPVALIDEGQSFVEVRKIHVVVNCPSALDIETFDKDRDWDAYQSELDAYRDKALTIAADLSSRFRLDFKQDWVQPSGEFPRIVGDHRLYQMIPEEDVARGFPGLVGLDSIRIVDDECVPSSEQLHALGKAFAEGALEPESDLLSEARYLASQKEARGAADRATLLAAIAVELRTKRVLRQVGAQAPVIVEIFLENPRDWSMAAHGLFAKAVPAFAGVTPTIEYKDVAKRVQRLFQRRNRIAHRGDSMTEQECQESVEAAMDAFRLLAGLRQSRE